MITIAPHAHAEMKKSLLEDSYAEWTEEGAEALCDFLIEFFEGSTFDRCLCRCNYGEVSHDELERDAMEVVTTFASGDRHIVFYI
jgi:hypothetical protein